MALAIDGSALLKGRKTGVERYVTRVLAELAAPDLLGREAVELWTPAPLQKEAVGTEVWKNRVLSLPYLNQGWTHLRVAAELTKNAPRAYWAPGHEVPFLTGKASILTTVHDVVFRTVPEAYAPLQRARQEWAIRHAVRHAEHLFAVSEATKADLMHWYGASPERITVTPLAPEPMVPVSAERCAQVAEEYGLTGRRLLLFVGRVERKKGSDRLLALFAALQQRSEYADVVLVLAGGVSADMQAEVAGAQGQIGSDRLRVLGYVADDIRAALYSLAAVFLFPTRGEGFGIPVLEAMAAGVPAIATNLPVMREVGADAVRYAEGEHVEDWVQQVQAVLDDQQEQQRMALAGRARAATFSWRATAEKTAHILRRYV